MKTEYPKKCWCGAILDTKSEFFDHDCNAWEWIVARDEENERI